MSSRPFLWGLLGVCLLHLALGFLYSYGIHSFVPGDEKRHAEYALFLAKEGRLPTLNDTKAAKHPPLYYWLVSDWLHQGKLQGDLDHAVKHARMFSVLAAGLALVYVALLVRLLLPGHSGVAVVSAATIAAMPPYSNLAVVGNDALGLAAQVAITYASCVVVLRGPRTMPLAHLACWIVVGGMVRIQAVLLLPLAMVAVAVGTWLHVSGTWKRKLPVAIALSTGLLLSGLLAWGWFYWHNHVTYGEISGAETLLARNPTRSPRGGFVWLMMDGGLWLTNYDFMWGRLAGQVYPEGTLRTYARLLLLCSTGGALWWAWRERHRIRSAGLASALTWAVAVGMAASIFVQVFYYYSRGGVFNPRYAYGAAWLVTMVMSLGFTCTKGPLLPILGTLSVFVLSLTQNLTYAARLGRTYKSFALEAALRRESLEAPSTWALLLLVVGSVGAGLVVASAVLGRPRRGFGGIAEYPPRAKAAPSEATVADGD